MGFYSIMHRVMSNLPSEIAPARGKRFLIRSSAVLACMDENGVDFTVYYKV